MDQAPATETPIVVLGGSFDPPHNGHLLLASLAGHALSASEVTLMPVSRSPGKPPPLASGADRLSMLEASCGDLEGRYSNSPVDEISLVASELELVRGGVSYTVDTVEQLAATGRPVIWIIGSDQAARIDQWHRWRDLVWLCRFAVAHRAGADPDWRQHFDNAVGPELAASAVAAVVEMPAIELSSSEIRRRLAAGLPVRWMVPDGALGVIHDRELYATEQRVGGHR